MAEVQMPEKKKSDTLGTALTGLQIYNQVKDFKFGGGESKQKDTGITDYGGQSAMKRRMEASQTA